MNISKTSWHYRVLGHFDLLKSPIYGPDSLCPYFWKVVFATTILPLMALLLVMFFALPFWWWLTATPLGIAVFVGIIDIGFLIYILKALVELRHLDEISEGTREAPEVKESLLKAWLKAKHRKMCPFLYVVD